MKTFSSIFSVLVRYFIFSYSILNENMLKYANINHRTETEAHHTIFTGTGRISRQVRRREYGKVSV